MDIHRILHQIKQNTHYLQQLVDPTKTEHMLNYKSGVINMQ